MHDLIHDLARKVAGNGSLVLTTSTKDFKGKLRHLSTDDFGCLANCVSSSYFSSETLRTCFNLSEEFYWFLPKGINVDDIISNCKRLRVLDLHESFNTRTLPNSLGKLLHLRYLDLSYNTNLEILPKSFTKLQNLQTLKLVRCRNLKELPKDMSKLVNLRMLDILQCDSLIQMPAGMDKLTCLHTLAMFVVRGEDHSEQDKKGERIELRTLINNLRGVLKIVDNAQTNYVSPIAHLKASKITCEFWSSPENSHETLESLLFPNNHDIREMVMEGYASTKLPSWVSVIASSLPGLVSIDLSLCNHLQHLSPSLSRLSHLKYLLLRRMANLEYIESNAPSPSEIFFPSLEKLVLEDMSNIRGWWRDLKLMEKEAGCLVDSNEQAVILPSFPHLRYLSIKFCETMTYLPPCPHVKELELYCTNEALTFCMKGGVVQGLIQRTSTTSFSNVSVSCALHKLSIDDPRVFNNVFREFVRGSVCIKLLNTEISGMMREGLQCCASSLQDLTVHQCSRLENMGVVGIQRLSNLKSLQLHRCSGNLDDFPWNSFHSLLSLTIYSHLNVVQLPKGIQYLISLKSLQICNCHNLKALGECLKSLTSLNYLQIKYCRKLKLLPESMCHLTSLTTLEIRSACSDLMVRCRKPAGVDWPKICHIPHIHIS